MPRGLQGQRRAAVLLLPEVSVFLGFALSACLAFAMYHIRRPLEIDSLYYLLCGVFVYCLRM